MTRLTSALPKEHDRNGLSWISRDLLANPHHRHLMIAVVDCSKITTSVDTGEDEPTARILRLERVHPQDAPEVERLLRRALEYRRGDTVLELDVEREIEQWLGEGFRLDPTTGELVPTDDDMGSLNGPDADDEEGDRG